MAATKRSKTPAKRSSRKKAAAVVTTAVKSPQDKSERSKSQPRKKSIVKKSKKTPPAMLSSEPPTSFLDRLQKRAQDNELEPTNTPDSLFLILCLLQTAVAYLLSSLLDHHLFFAQGIFLNAATVSLCVHWGGFAFSSLIGSCKFFDITEDIGMIYMLYSAYQTIRGTPTLRQTTVFYCASLWGLRLVSFVGYRVLVRGRDFRFDKLIKAPAYNLFGWTSGGSWCWINGFCLWALASNVDDRSGPLTWLDYGGLAIFVFGLFIETIADLQKYSFNVNTKSGQNTTWIASGLWGSWSRHPNYVGEIVVWVGLAIVCMGGADSSWLGGYGASEVFAKNALRLATVLITPVWSMFFLVFTSMMLLEKRGDAKWSDSKSWNQYKKNTPVLFPDRLPTMLEMRLS